MLHFVSSFCALVALLAGPASAYNDTKPDDYYARSRQFLREFYPQLDPYLCEEIQVINRLGDPDIMNHFVVKLYEQKDSETGGRREGDVDQPRPSGQSTEAEESSSADPVLWAEFLFSQSTENKELIRVMVGAGRESRHEKLVEEVNRHPEWQETRILAALRDGGARFGPDHKAEFVRALPIKKLEPFVGELEVRSAEFKVRGGGLEEPHQEAQLTWIVRAKWHSPDRKQEADCVLEFEPFDGSLMLMVRRISPRPTTAK